MPAKGLKNEINSFLPETHGKSVQLTQLPDTTQLTCHSLHPDANKAIMTDDCSMVCLESFLQKKKLTIVFFKKIDIVHANDTTEAFLSRAGTLKPKHSLI